MQVEKCYASVVCILNTKHTFYVTFLLKFNTITTLKF